MRAGRRLPGSRHNPHQGVNDGQQDDETKQVSVRRHTGSEEHNEIVAHFQAVAEVSFSPGMVGSRAVLKVPMVKHNPLVITTTTVQSRSRQMFKDSLLTHTDERIAITLGPFARTGSGGAGRCGEHRRRDRTAARRAGNCND